MDFIALDVETANADMASICAVGLYRFAGGEPVDGMHFLVDPRDRFDALNVRVHGITPERVSGAPTMAEVLPVLCRALSDGVIVHHTHFDRVALHQAALKCGVAALKCRWLDTAQVARRAWEEVAFSGYGLRNLADMLKIEFEHHNAREDARAAGMVLLHACAKTGFSLEHWLGEIGDGGSINMGTGRPRRAKESIRLNGHPVGPLYGETVVFTGDLSVPRAEAARIAAAAGCDVHPGVTKTTTILVVGDQDIRVVGATGKSSKHRKAEAMIAKGATIRIIGESDFKTLIG